MRSGADGSSPGVLEMQECNLALRTIVAPEASLNRFANGYEYAEDQRSGSQDPRRWDDAHRLPEMSTDN